MDHTNLTYTEWERQVIEELSDILECSYSDADGVATAQPFIVHNSWNKGMDPKQVAWEISNAN